MWAVSGGGEILLPRSVCPASTEGLYYTLAFCPAWAPDDYVTFSDFPRFAPPGAGLGRIFWVGVGAPRTAICPASAPGGCPLRSASSRARHLYNSIWMPRRADNPRWGRLGRRQHAGPETARAPQPLPIEEPAHLSAVASIPGWGGSCGTTTASRIKPYLPASQPLTPTQRGRSRGKR